MNLDEIIRCPQGITPHGEYQLLSGRLPMMHYHSYDGGADFRLLGGLASPYADPARAAIAVKSLKGLVPPWQMVDQKGATQHGVTVVGSLFDPCEVTAELMFVGDDPAARLALARLFIEANHQLKPGELAYINHQTGRWWAPVHWYKTPPDKILWAAQHSQPFTQVWRAPSALWQTFDSIDAFRPIYRNDGDPFSFVQVPGLGAGWVLAYSGTGGGYIYADGNQAAWADDPEDPILTSGRTVVCRRTGYVSGGDYQVVTMQIGSFPEWNFPDNANNQIWARMGNSSSPGTDGVVATIGISFVQLSYHVGGTEYVLRSRPLLIPPIPGEVWTLVAGYEGNPRLFKIFRSGIPVMTVSEPGTGSLLGAGYRSAGFAMHAGAAILSQATPAAVTSWEVGENTTVTQSGFVKLINPGDQPMFPRYTCFGPGTFRIANGPGSGDYIQFGPLLPNQVMQIRSDSELRSVVDMTSVAPTPQELNIFQQALKDFISFATAGNVPPLLQQIESIFGIIPPQGHPYSLLSGRLSNPIPAKPVGKPAQEQYISVSIDDGNADSMILAAGTPLRRYPL